MDNGHWPFGFDARQTISVLLVVIMIGLSMGAFAQVDMLTAPTGQGHDKFDTHLLDALSVDPARVGVIVMTQGPPGPVAAAAGGMVSFVDVYTIIDGFSGTFSPDRLAELAEREDVVALHLDREIQTLMDQSHKAIEADKAWNGGPEGDGVTVAVIDTGIDRTHPWFRDTLLNPVVVACVSTIIFIVNGECQDTHGHGTHVAGSVASRSGSYPGIAPDANLAVLRAMPGAIGSVSDAVRAMDWVGNNKDNVDPPIRVATMSLGYAYPGCGDDSDPWAKAANALVEKGVTFTVAAGNEGHGSCTIDGAAAASQVITVASVDIQGSQSQDNDEIASSSSGGPFGAHYKPDVAFPGVGITSASFGGGILISTSSGTSMATPHAAGVAALLLEDDPLLDPHGVKQRILDSALENPNTGSTPNRVYGHGLGNACRALQLSTCRPIP